jgi:enoyl-CoA hydratase/carnithine racemase
VTENQEEERAMAEDVLLVEIKDRIAYLTMNRPEKLNAVDEALAQRLIDTFYEMEKNPDVLVMVLSGKGRAFCSGADMVPGSGSSGKAPLGLIQHRTYIENGVRRFKPVVGCVQGYALGMGALLAVQGCDIVVAGESALFGFPEGKAGFPVPPIVATPWLPMKISLEFLLLGWKGADLMGPQRAYELGMINKVVPDDKMLEEATRYAQALCLVPPGYIKSMKTAHYRSALLPASVAELNYIEHSQPQTESPNMQELWAAAKEKRSPRFRGDY